MFEIGDSLREARTRRGLSSADVQKAIRIRERYLTALEEEQWDMLPGDAYTKGFLRTYAEFMGLDGNLYIDEYNSRIAHRDEEPLVPGSLAISRRSRRGVLRMLMAILALGGAVAGLAAWGMSGSPTAAPAKAPVAGANTPSPTSRVTHKVKHPVAPVVAPATSVAATSSTISAARGRCWLSVRAGGPAGAVLFEGVLEQGKKLHFGLQHDLWLRMGAPTALDITVGGQKVNGLPASPGNVLLTPSGPQAA